MEKMIRFLVRQWKGEEIDPQTKLPDSGAGADAAALEKDVKKIWDSAGKYKEKAFEPDVDANWQKFKNRIHSAPLETEATPVRRLVPRYWWAAASIAAIALVSWLVFGQMGADSVIKTFATNSRQIKKVVLPDQSVVWLNSNSEISFDKNFNRRSLRNVKLRGEAFFEVQPNPARPFQVETPHGLIEVLGTSFNVRGLKIETQTEVQVMHGLVALMSKEQDSKRIEVPANFVGYISADAGRLNKEIVQNTKVFASAQVWRTRKINLEQRTLAEAQEIMRRYTDKRLEFSDPRLANCIFTWTLQLDKPEASLQLLAQSGNFRLEKTTSTVFRLEGKACPK